jgi:hypothetical protein
MHQPPRLAHFLSVGGIIEADGKIRVELEGEIEGRLREPASFPVIGKMTQMRAVAIAKVSAGFTITQLCLRTT